MNAIRDAIKQLEVGWKSQKVRLVGANLDKDNDIPLLIDTLRDHETVKSLEISGCYLGENNAVELARGMQSFHLIGLQMVHVNLTDKAAIALATAVQECSLKKLDLSVNHIGVRGALALANALTDCGLEALLLARNDIVSKGALRFAEVLSLGGTSLRTLDLSWNPIGNAAVVALARALPNSLVDTLYLDGTGMTHQGVVALCGSISGDFICLSLGGNNLKDKSVLVLAEMIKHSRLERLSLNVNLITDIGVAALAEAIHDSKTMQSLDLRYNRQVKDIAPLFRSIKTHQTMKTVLLDETRIPNAKKLQQLLTNLHSERAQLMIIFCSVHMVPRLGVYSTARMFPFDLMRKLSAML